MKKICSLILCLCLFLSCAGAESLSQEVMAQAFMTKLQERFGGFDFTNDALRLNLVSEGSELFSAAFQTGESLAQLCIESAGAEGPLVVQTDMNTFWYSANGEVYAITPAEIIESLASTAGSAPSAAVDPEMLSSLASLFAADVIMPGIAVESTDESTVIRISTTGQKLLDGLCAFGDHVIENEEYTSALVDLLTAGGMPYEEAAQLKEQWPEMRKELADTRIDLWVDGEIVVSSSGFTCDLSLSDGKENYSLTASAETTASGTKVLGTLSRTVNESTFILADMDFACGRHSLRGILTFPMARCDAHLTASWSASSRKSGSMQAMLTVNSENFRVFSMTFNESHHGAAVSANAVFTLPQMTAALNFSIDQSGLAVSLQSGTEGVSVRALLDDNAVCSLLQFSVTSDSECVFDLLWDGEKVTLLDQSGKTVIRGSFESETLYRIGITLENLHPQDGREHSPDVFLEALLPDDGTLLLARGLDPSGTEAFVFKAAPAEKTEIVPLADKEPTVIDLNWIMENLSN